MLPLPPRSTLFPYTTLFRSASSTSRQKPPDLHELDRQYRAGRDRGRADRIPGGGAAVRRRVLAARAAGRGAALQSRSEEHTSELQSQSNLVCRLLLEKKKNK